MERLDHPRVPLDMGSRVTYLGHYVARIDSFAEKPKRCSYCQEPFHHGSRGPRLVSPLDPHQRRLMCSSASHPEVHVFHEQCLHMDKRRPACPVEGCAGEVEARQQQHQQYQHQRVQGQPKPCLGMDFGGVIMPKHGDDADTSFLNGAKYLDSRTAPGTKRVIAGLVDLFGAEQTYIVSKAGTNVSRKTAEWLKHVDFYKRTGLLEQNVIFCKERKDKAPICSNKHITHFIDDRSDVLQHMVGRVPYLYLFGDEEPLQKNENTHGSDVAGLYTHVRSWEHVSEVISAQINDSNNNT